MSAFNQKYGNRAIDLTQYPPFGALKAVEVAGYAPNRDILWRCICECGNERVVNGSYLRKGTITSCGCMDRAWNAASLIGSPPFGRLTVIAAAGKTKTSQLLWLCRCDCGKETVVDTGRLRSGTTKSCGCLRRETTSANMSKHRMAGTAEHRIWKGMKMRCQNDNHKDFQWYGKLGVTVCAKWRGDFLAFYNDVGSRPSDRHSIDRKDSRGHYSCGACDECLANGWPANCQWSTDTRQARNKRNVRLYTVNGETMCLPDLCEKLNLSISAVRDRLQRGWSLEDAFSVPIRNSKR